MGFMGGIDRTSALYDTLFCDIPSAVNFYKYVCYDCGLTTILRNIVGHCVCSQCKGQVRLCVLSTTSSKVCATI